MRLRAVGAWTYGVPVFRDPSDAPATAAIAGRSQRRTSGSTPPRASIHSAAPTDSAHGTRDFRHRRRLLEHDHDRRARPRLDKRFHDVRRHMPAPRRSRLGRDSIRYPGVSAGLWSTTGRTAIRRMDIHGLRHIPSRYRTQWPASVRLDVSPKDADVYVDGYYAGIVSDFNGVFHHLTLTAGPHAIEMRKTGLETLTLEMYVQPNHTITYRAAMQPAQSGSVNDETEPGRRHTSGGHGTMPSGVPGDLCFDVTPKDAQVYVDGYYVGTARDWEGRRQRLTLAPGAHRVELQAADYEPAQFDITIESRQTTTYRGALTRAKP